MGDRSQLYWGNTPVPYTVSWSGEGQMSLGPCPHARRDAICENSARGVGRPRFGAPHANRQRETIALDLCDLCGRPLKNRTKVSLSHARSVTHAAAPLDVLQVEPLLHRECAAVCMDFCPSLKGQLAAGDLFVRQVTQHRVQFALYSAQGVFEATGVRRIAVSHAKVQLVRWSDRDLEWLARPVREGRTHPAIHG